MVKARMEALSTKMGVVQLAKQISTVQEVEQKGLARYFEVESLVATTPKANHFDNQPSRLRLKQTLASSRAKPEVHKMPKMITMTNFTTWMSLSNS